MLSKFSSLQKIPNITTNQNNFSVGGGAGDRNNIFWILITFFNIFLSEKNQTYHTSLL